YTKVLHMRATAYSRMEPGLSDYTATGAFAEYGVVAVDPSVIPLGTKLYVEGYGICSAEDTGGAIKGNKIDLCFNTVEECKQFGVRNVTVYVLA
ncbi:MAG: 3D domain-containing protein, partial [Firmicutes bacterium]|nr:3D domain-containing protein [Bacillota bacterium]